MDDVQAIGIFEGGGARGLAHIGAVSFCEKRGLKFEAVAGTSAGAIVAALVAAGYSAEEMLHPAGEDDPTLPDRELLGLFQQIPFDVIDRTEWRRLRRFAMACDKILWPISIYRRCRASTWIRRTSRAVFGTLFVSGLYFSSGIGFPVSLRYLILFLGITYGMLCAIKVMLRQFGINSLIGTFGFLKTDHFVNAFNAWLVEKCVELRKDKEFVPRRGDGKVCFGELKTPLTVIAQDVQTRKLITFSKVATPDESVALAVAASMAIPFIFRPVSIDGMKLIDGGAVSSYPAWAVDDFLKEPDPFKLLLGFRLGSEIKSPIETFSQYAVAVFKSLVFGDDSLQKRGVEALRDVRLETSTSLLDFELSNRQKWKVVQDGLSSAASALAGINRTPNEAKVRQYLVSVLHYMENALDLKGSHLRANVALPVGDRLRVCSPTNFDKSDCDDNLEFGFNQGAIGRCWRTRTFVVCDLTEADEEFLNAWNMTKYQLNHIRKDRKTLLSVPIVHKNDWDPVECRVVEKGKIYGVLSIDSDADLCEVFEESGGLCAIECGFMVVDLLNQHI